jgi:hypothetical protein
MCATRNRYGGFRHEQRDADVDANHVGADPAGVGIEGIGETVAAPDFLAADFAHPAQRGDTFVRGERQRAARRARHECAIGPARCERRQDPARVTVHAVGRGHPHSSRDQSGNRA